MNIQQSIHNWMTEHRQSAVRLLKRFVEEASVQGSEKHAQAIVIERLRQLQLDIDIWEPDEKTLRTHEAFASNRSSFRDSPNVVGVLKGKGGENPSF